LDIEHSYSNIAFEFESNTITSNNTGADLSVAEESVGSMLVL